MTFWICPSSALPNEWGVFRLIVILTFAIQLTALYFINPLLFRKTKKVITGIHDVLKIRKNIQSIKIIIFFFQLIFPVLVGLLVVSELTAEIVISMIILSLFFSLIVIISYAIMLKFQSIPKRYK